MKLTVISDTHMRHEELGALHGDILIHCGDVLDLFDTQKYDLDRVDDWFGSLDFDLIFCIGGNHDFELEERKQFKNAIYLEDQPVDYQGIKFYGTPWVPDLPQHAYNATQQERIAKWQMIPEGTDVLITHTPPKGVLDQSRTGRSLGCTALHARLANLDLKYHLFGHVHASGGQMNLGSHWAINASCFKNHNEPLRAPIVLEM